MIQFWQEVKHPDFWGKYLTGFSARAFKPEIDI